MGDRWWEVDENIYATFCADPANSENILLKYFNALSYQNNERAMVVLEYVFGVLSFTREQRHTYTQAMALLSIHRTIFNQFIIGMNGTKEEAIDVFKTEIKQLCANGLYDVEGCRQAATFFSTGLVRNFDAYQYALSHLPVESVQSKLLCVQTPHQLPPISVAELQENASVNSSIAHE